MKSMKFLMRSNDKKKRTKLVAVMEIMMPMTILMRQVLSRLLKEKKVKRPKKAKMIKKLQVVVVLQERT